MKYLYKYPQAAYPYVDLIRQRGRYDLEYELLDTGVFDGDRYFDVFVDYAKGEPEDGINNFIVNGQQAATNRPTSERKRLPSIWVGSTD